MLTMGVDIGSASSKVVILKDGAEILAGVAVPVGTGTTGPSRALQQALEIAKVERNEISKVVITGYGRMTFEGADEQISEITCHAKGVHHLVPSARTIIDIGGQDAKVIKLDEQGYVSNFVMNEKCAAGTGRFLEVMARVLEVHVSELQVLGDKADKVVPISSTCTVFAESEVISQLAAGQKSSDVVAGIHQSVARRVAGLVGRVGITPEVVMTGGVAQNAGVVKALEKELQVSITVAPRSQLTGALGAALIAFESSYRAGTGSTRRNKSR
ncbi:MAG: 2-hydroxyglutaryl-CoA dehydratase [Syntrophomonadaceae bacterium]|nr:2-hydroxyglutaryl-CoA dehydratase [Syntrophomonadaceae bacterium]